MSPAYSFRAFLVAVGIALLWRVGLWLAACLWDRCQAPAVYTDVPQDLPPFWVRPQPKPRIRVYPTVHRIAP